MDSLAEVSRVELITADLLTGQGGIVQDLRHDQSA